MKEGKAKVALAKGDTEAAASAMANLESLSTLLGYMNNKAVALARCGKTDEAIELYNNTCLSIPPKRSDLVAIVKYNLALALVRADKFEEAQSVLEEVNKIEKSRVRQKAASLSLRLKRAMENGSEFQLQQSKATESTADKTETNTDATMSSEEDNAKLLAKIAAEPGDICCFKVFTVPGDANAKAESLCANTPRFKRRSAIEREEALGAEKASKAS